MPSSFWLVHSQKAARTPRDRPWRTVARVNQIVGSGIELATIFEHINADEGRLRPREKG